MFSKEESNLIFSPSLGEMKSQNNRRSTGLPLSLYPRPRLYRGLAGLCSSYPLSDSLSGCFFIENNLKEKIFTDIVIKFLITYLRRFERVLISEHHPPPP